MDHTMTPDIQARIRLWSTSARFDEKTREETLRIAKDPALTLQCFGQELDFGTGGLRGKIGVGSNRMNPYTVARTTQGVLNELKARGGKSVAISYDSRHFSKDFAQIAAGVMAQGGVHAHIYPQLMPTPLLSYAVRHLGCDAGIMITASHNPSVYNGYKVYGADGCQLTDDGADRILREIESIHYENLEWMDLGAAVASGFYHEIPPEVFAAYLQRTLACRVTDEPVGDLRIVYTPLHGTGLEPVRTMLQTIGATQVFEVQEQLSPDGNFPTCPKPNPELPEALTLALRDCETHNAQLMLATDPDCDRVGVAARDSDGKMALLTGNEIGVLMLDYLLAVRKEKGVMPPHPAAISTIVSTRLVKPVCEAYNTELHLTLTGFKYIGEVMSQLEKAGRSGDFILGFEESVGYLGGMHVRDKDGVMAVMHICDMARYHADRGHTLWEAMQEAYQKYGWDFSRLLTLELTDVAVPMERMKEVMKELRDHTPRVMADSPVTEVVDFLPGAMGLPKSDVLRLINGRGDQVLIRPSGTEPKVKMYLSANGGSRAASEERLDALEAEVRKWVR